MAEILLARIHGPSGFERPAVIKRILPHLAEVSSFVDMFLDEARIAARIGHPNVVQVQELGREAGELFLVMEYLEGESGASVMRRLTSRGQLLDPLLAAHVASQAAAGLHAAHELTDPQGRPIGLVHRDVSPQNIFITYDGSVKVLDFGIAKAADRISHTEAGVLKGKFDYMSPEQARGEPVDRRSDLYALGIVLYEISTGRRLFRRQTQVETLRAVSDGQVARPSQMNPRYPAQLEAVVLKALAKDPDQRYQTAAEMRRDLMRAMHSLGTDGLADERLSGLMGDLFPDRIAQKQTMMDSVRAGTVVSQVPAAEADMDVELPSVSQPQEGERTPPSASRVVDLRRAEEALALEGGRRRLWPLVAGVLVLCAGIGSGAAWVALSEGADGSDPTAASRASTAPPAPPLEGRAAAGAREPLRPEPQAGEEPAAPPVTSEIALHVHSSPPGATVFVNDEPRGAAPLQVSLPRSEEPTMLRLEREGYEPVEQAVVPSMDQLFRIALEREPPRRQRRMRRATTDEEPTAPEPVQDRSFRRFD